MFNLKGELICSHALPHEGQRWHFCALTTEFLPYRVWIVAAILIACGCTKHAPPAKPPRVSHGDQARAIVLNNRGLTKALAGEFAGAMEDYNEAIQLDAGYSDAFYNRGCCRYEQGNAKLAIEDFSQAIKNDPNHSDAYSARANAWFHTHEFEKAIADFSEAIRIGPLDARDFYYRGLAWYNINRLDKATDDYTHALKLNSNYAQAYGERGVARYKSNNYRDAIADFDEAIRIEPRDFNCICRRGMAWNRLGEFTKAIEDFEECSRLNPSHAFSHDLLAWLLATCQQSELRNGKRAVKLATIACDLTNWKEGTPIETLAAAYAEIGEFDEAVKFQRRAMELLVDETIVKDGQARLELYQQHQPYRDYVKKDFEIR